MRKRKERQKFREARDVLLGKTAAVGKKRERVSVNRLAVQPADPSYVIPAAIRKRFFKRAGCARSGDEATAPLNAIMEREAGRIMGLATQQAVLDGISSVKARHVARALAILDRPVY